MLPTNVSSTAKSSNMTSFNNTNSVIVSLPGKQYLKCIISLPLLLESAMLKEQNSIVKLYYYLSKHLSFFFRIFLWFTVHPKGQIGTFVINYITMVLLSQIISYIRWKIQVIFFLTYKFWRLVCFVCIYFKLKLFICLLIFKLLGLSYKFWSNWSVHKYNLLYLLLCNIISNMIELSAA